ncbi:dTDP-4-dehydrorhamnose 3,5-epimerase [Oscillibacter sp.]|uniref:dTDP-4-dehydrorhamnose 3,5-epimerase n=1 Tax=Oscillibacter sp. TaxID=1945593 RepID=UPI002898594E|nr:dTDP-4-dehydrorhamnose 3,5-epimerase [Oscillibacter sp.]
MRVTGLELQGVKIIEPKVFTDDRGYSFESFSKKEMEANGIHYNFVLDYEAMNLKKGTLRGIHFQNNPHPQTKLVRVLQGEIMDVVVDLRKDSPTFKQWITHTISAENQKQLLISNGFGHAFLTKADNTVVLYKFDDFYDSSLVRTIRWNDPEINIDWGTQDPILSTGDANAVCLTDSDVNFTVSENR